MKKTYSFHNILIKLLSLTVTLFLKRRIVMCMGHVIKQLFLSTLQIIDLSLSKKHFFR